MGNVAHLPANQNATNTKVGTGKPQVLRVSFMHSHRITFLSACYELTISYSHFSVFCQFANFQALLRLCAVFPATY